MEQTKHRTAAVVLLSVQAAMAAVIGIAALAWASDREDIRPLLAHRADVAGLFTLIGAGLLVAVAVGVHRRSETARVLGTVLEAVVAVAALGGLRHRPAGTLVWLGLVAATLIVTWWPADDRVRV